MTALLAQLVPAGAPMTTVQAVVVALLCLGGVALVSLVAYVGFSLPHRRLERARFFLDVLASGMARGRKPEDTIVELARTRETDLGVRFHLLAAHLESGHGLQGALERVPALLPPQALAALRAGLEAGRLPEMIPVCQEMLKDGPARTQHLLHYVIALITAGTPYLLAVLVMMQVQVVPQFARLADELGEGEIQPLSHTPLFVATLVGAGLLVLNLVILLGLLAHFLGPYWRRWTQRWLPPWGDFLALVIPWKRKRMLRDFAGTLALLLDARLPEDRAVVLAAETTANHYYEQRGRFAAAQLRGGHGLVAAVAGFDPTGELRWRISNATHGGQSFSAALRGWREALQAHAFREEQSSAHVITSVMVLLNGLMVGLVVVTLLGLLVRIMDAAALW